MSRLYLEPVGDADQDQEEVINSREITEEIMETRAELTVREVVAVECNLVEAVITHVEAKVYGMAIEDEEVQTNIRRTIGLGDTAEYADSLGIVTYSGVRSYQSTFQEETRRALQRTSARNAWERIKSRVITNPTCDTESTSAPQP